MRLRSVLRKHVGSGWAAAAALAAFLAVTVAAMPAVLADVGHGADAAAGMEGGVPAASDEHPAAEPQPAGEAAAEAAETDVAWATNRLLVVGGEAFVESLLTYILAFLWLLALALHLGRPYILQVADKFTLRLGADLWWLAYVLLRDLVLVATFVLSLFYYYPMLVEERPFPMTAPLAATLLFAALVLKLVGDPDEDLRQFLAVTALLGLGSLLYLVPVMFGVFATAVPALRALAPYTVTQVNPRLGLAVLWVSLAGVGLLGAVAVGYVLRTARPARES